MKTCLSDSEHRMVANYMRRITRSPYVTDSTMRRDLLDYITDNELVKATHWPGYFTTITERGMEFLAESEADDE